jgi:hypothetical protein
MGELYFFNAEVRRGGRRGSQRNIEGFFGVRLRAGFEQIVASMVRVGAGLVTCR